MSTQGFPEARSQRIELKRLLVAAMTDEQRLYQRYSEAVREVDRWRHRAELALSRGDEDLARAALTRASDHTTRASQFQQRYLEQKEYVERMKLRLRDLESGVRGRPAAALPDLTRLERSLAQLERWEERSQEERARLAAWAELERDELAEKLEALEREDQLERQLAELKQRLGKSED